MQSLTMMYVFYSSITILMGVKGMERLQHKITNSCIYLVYQINAICLFSAFWMGLSTILPHTLVRGQYTKIMVDSVHITYLLDSFNLVF